MLGAWMGDAEVRDVVGSSARNSAAGGNLSCEMLLTQEGGRRAVLTEIIKAKCIMHHLKTSSAIHTGGVIPIFHVGSQL